MKFSCFPTPSILGQRGSINLSRSRNDESNAISNGNVKSPVVTSYRQSGEPDLSHGVIRSLPGVTIFNGTGPPVHTKGKAPSPPRQNHSLLSIKQEQENARISDVQPANPRGGIIGRTPTPPSAPSRSSVS